MILWIIDENENSSDTFSYQQIIVFDFFMLPESLQMKDKI